MLSKTYYAQNYAGIIGLGLVTCNNCEITEKLNNQEMPGTGYYI